MPSKSSDTFKVAVMSDHYYIKEIYFQGLNSFLKQLSEVDVNGICSSLRVMVGFVLYALLA